MPLYLYGNFRGKIKLDGIVRSGDVPCKNHCPFFRGKTILSVDVVEATASVEMLGVVGACHGCLAFASGLAFVTAGRMTGFGICLCQVKKASPSSFTLPGNSVARSFSSLGSRERS